MTIDWIGHLRKWIPRSWRYWIQQFVSLDEMKIRWRENRDPLSAVIHGESGDGKIAIRLGILKNRAQYHLHYVKACQEMGVAFRVIDLATDDWLAAVHSSRCDAYLAWPDATQTPFAKMYKDRCDLIERELGLRIVPTAAERWLYEDKWRQRDWMQVRNIPHPRTWLFMARAQAEEFAETCELPIVSKTSFGGGATGVRIVRKRGKLRSLIRAAFGRGIVAGGHDYRDREWGRILFQEYLPDVREWRMVRIGDSYFGHPKGQLGEFHSGSGRVEWDIPDERLLNLLYDVTEAAGFRSMDVDVFETLDGCLLVNELQTVFGASVSIDQMRLDGCAGRMVRDPQGAWKFEPGDFARNACANERIRVLVLQNF